MEQLYVDIILIALEKEKTLAGIRKNFRIKMCIAGLYCYYNEIDENQLLTIFGKKSVEILTTILQEDSILKASKKGIFGAKHIEIKDTGRREKLISAISANITSGYVDNSLSILAAILIQSTLIQKGKIEIPKDSQNAFMSDVEKNNLKLHAICKKIKFILAANY